MNGARWTLLVLAVGALAYSCVGSQRQNTIGGIAGEPAFVEAFIEYSGPRGQWAGPASFLLHVSAKEGEKVTVKVTPKDLYRQSGGWVDVTSRAPAAGVPLTAPAPDVPVTAEAAPEASEVMRDRLEGLAEAIEQSQETFRACVNPIRVRMVRADGAVKDWQGCRGSRGWAKSVSEFTHEVLKGLVRG